MRKVAIIVAVTAILWSFAITPSIIHASQPFGAEAPSEHSRQRDKISIISAADIVGKLITDRSGNDAGRILSLVIDHTDGKIEYVLIDGSPNFDLGGQLVAVPWSLMALGPDARTISVNVTADELRHAPLIDRSLAYQLVASNSQTRRYGYWGYPRGVDPYGYGDLGPGDPYRPGFRRPHGGYAVVPGAPRARTITQRIRRDRLAELERQTGDPAEKQRIRIIRTARAEGPSANREPRNSGQNPSDQRSGAGGNQAQNLTVDQKDLILALMSPATTSASGLKSAGVYSENGSLVGHVDQIAIDAARGDIAYLLIKRHGSPRRNARRFALPVQALAWATLGSGNYRLKVSEGLLRNVPSVPAPKRIRSSFIPEQHLAELYAHFGIGPYWQKLNTASDQHAPETTRAIAGQVGAVDSKDHRRESEGQRGSAEIQNK